MCLNGKLSFAQKEIPVRDELGMYLSCVIFYLIIGIDGNTLT